VLFIVVSVIEFCVIVILAICCACKRGRVIRFIWAIRVIIKFIPTINIYSYLLPLFIFISKLLLLLIYLKVIDIQLHVPTQLHLVQLHVPTQLHLVQLHVPTQLHLVQLLLVTQKGLLYFRERHGCQIYERLRPTPE
jgi:hypothetical protein